MEFHISFMSSLKKDKFYSLFVEKWLLQLLDKYFSFENIYLYLKQCPSY